MRKISYKLEIGYPSCSDEGEAEVDDNMNNDEIDTMVHDMAQEYGASWEGDERLAWDEEMSEDEYEDATESFYENVEGSWKFIA